MATCVAIGALAGTGCVADEGSGGEPTTDSVESNLTPTDSISGLNFVMTTGSDDKRSDSHVFIAVHIKNSQGQLQTLTQEAGLGQTWSNNSVHSQLVSLPVGTLDSNIISFTISWQQGGGGWNGDNWNLQQLQVVANDATLGTSSTQMSLAGNPLFRFTGSSSPFNRQYVP